MPFTRLFRRLFQGPAASPRRARSFVPRLTALEDRSLPSATTVVAPPPSPPAVLAPQHQVPFKEHLTVTSVSDGVYTYEGHASHLGHVTAFSFPDGSFVKVAADGDQIFGQLYPSSETTGTMTFTGGTGRFAHVSGSASYVISIHGKAGTREVDVVGTLSYDGDDGDKGGPKAQAFSITGGGPAPTGLPLAPDVLAPHTATGTASFLGAYTGSGTFEQEALAIDPSTGAVTANFQGTFTFVAANGDKLVTHYGTGFTGKLTGQFTGTAVVGVQFDAVFVIDGAASTGRFAGASGSWRMIAHAESVSLASMVPGYTAPFDYTWTGGGTITFAKGKK
jgi:hypothetical protein